MNILYSFVFTNLNPNFFVVCVKNYYIITLIAVILLVCGLTGMFLSKLQHGLIMGLCGYAVFQGLWYYLRLEGYPKYVNLYSMLALLLSVNFFAFLLPTFFKCLNVATSGYTSKQLVSIAEAVDEAKTSGKDLHLVKGYNVKFLTCKEQIKNLWRFMVNGNIPKSLVNKKN